MVQKLSQDGNDMKNCQLVIDIKNVTDSNQSLLPKLELKNS
jgi:hypothetical protein